ncbi:uncharacterized protein BDW43DRAFT_301808 [Aspergillus alliaceus]|uniref:uncharacterized protein n=1 Tax=Petromyces alliaceus TaxID=209559 RepID=UPI0012A649C3|nr:uncharacterized protein BDW43DRAFT_301808 [Aspergillus alliaceus]KAB8231364.1 hypothetical protein BDW43DRAFT_301808 [Aspergillus alliaceus]
MTSFCLATLSTLFHPFLSSRGIQHFGEWRVLRLPPVGPVIEEALRNGLCGHNIVSLRRLPFIQPTKQTAWTWSHSKDTRIDHPPQPLVKQGLITCTVISRTTLMGLFCVTNARPIFRCSSASGPRAAYASHCGQWSTEWPIWDLARVYFTTHDSRTLSNDVYPPFTERRVDKCLQMLAGVIYTQTPSGIKCVFPGHKASSSWILKYSLKGFGGAHSGRHCYHMIGGDVSDVDLLRSLNTALDCLPWSSLSWSVHRGLRDIHVAVAKDRMDIYWGALADALGCAVLESTKLLDARWRNPGFVRNQMADMAESAVLADRGNSGGIVRMVTDIALTLWDGTVAELGETSFWRLLSPAKCSSHNDLDHRMYHDFPLDKYLG